MLLSNLYPVLLEKFAQELALVSDRQINSNDRWINFDGCLLGDLRKSKPPCAVDTLYFNKDEVYYIEFKKGKSISHLEDKFTCSPNILRDSTTKHCPVCSSTLATAKEVFWLVSGYEDRDYLESQIDKLAICPSPRIVSTKNFKKKFKIS